MIEPTRDLVLTCLGFSAKGDVTNTGDYEMIIKPASKQSFRSITKAQISLPIGGIS